MRIVYIAHQLGSEKLQREANRKAASKMVAFLAEHFEISPHADWIVLSGEWPETPEKRRLGLLIDVAAIEKCEEVWLTGPALSEGMTVEKNHALMLGKPVHSLLGILPDVVNLDAIRKIVLLTPRSMAPVA